VIVNNPRVMRDLPRLLRQAGLDLVEVTAHVYADIGAGGFFANAVASYGPVLTGAALLTAEEIERWRAAQACAMADGTFFAAANYYTYLARRTPADACGGRGVTTSCSRSTSPSRGPTGDGRVIHPHRCRPPWAHLRSPAPCAIEGNCPMFFPSPWGTISSGAPTVEATRVSASSDSMTDVSAHSSPW
jgi:hypothetical protein